MKEASEFCGYEDCFGGPCKLPIGHENPHDDTWNAEDVTTCRQSAREG